MIDEKALLYIGALGGLFAGVAIWQNHRQAWLAEREAEIRDSDYHSKLILRYASNGRDRHTAVLDVLLAWCDAWYGPDHVSWRAALRCLSMSIFYSFAAFLAGWVFLNASTPGNVALFGRVHHLEHRLLYAAVMLLILAGLLFLGETLVRNISKLAATFASGSKLLHVLLVVTGLSLAAVAMSLVLNTVFLVAVFAGDQVPWGSWLIFAQLLFPMMFGLFFVALPLANAMADWCSVGATRYFLNKARAQNAGRRQLMRLLMYDLFFGMLCLVGLFAALIATISIWNAVLPRAAPFDWQGYWLDALKNPVEGLALWLMALTTLLPTIVHLIWAFSAVMIGNSKLSQTVRSELISLGPHPSDARVNEIGRNLFRLYALGHALSAVLFVALLTVALSLVHAFLP